MVRYLTESTQAERDELRRGLEHSPDDAVLRMANDADRLAQIERRVRELADEMEREAYAAVPPEYADRGLHYKYLRLDTEAAGKDEAADRLRAILDAPEEET